MGFLDIFSRENIDIAKAAGREFSEVMADGHVTTQELLDSGSDLALAAAEAYGVADQPLVTIADTEVTSRVQMAVGSINGAIHARLQDGTLTVREAIELVHKVGDVLMTELVDDTKAPLGADAK